MRLNFYHKKTKTKEAFSLKRLRKNWQCFLIARRLLTADVHSLKSVSWNTHTFNVSWLTEAIAVLHELKDKHLASDLWPWRSKVRILTGSAFLASVKSKLYSSIILLAVENLMMAWSLLETLISICLTLPEALISFKRLNSSCIVGLGNSVSPAVRKKVRLF